MSIHNVCFLICYVCVCVYISQNQPYCFRKSTPPPPTPTCLPDEYRFDCGKALTITEVYQKTKNNGCTELVSTGVVGTTQEQCEQQGCCWNPADVS